MPDDPCAPAAGWCPLCKRNVSRLCLRCRIHVYWVRNPKGQALVVGMHTGTVNCHVL